MITTIMIGNKIAEARKKKNLSQAQLADLLFISSQAVGKWERGESMPDIITFNRLAETLDVDLNYFSENFPSAATPIPAQTVQPVADAEPPRKTGWDMSGGNWVDADFSGLKNLHDKFSGSNMQKCLFKGSDLSGLLLKGNNVQNCDFSDSDFGRSRIRNSYLTDNQFRNCSLLETEFTGSYVSGCDLTGADLTGVIMKSGGIEKNILTGARLKSTSFKDSHIVNTVFSGAMEDCSFDNCSFTRVTFENVTVVNTFFKCKTKSLKKIRFINCKVDRMTYAFLKNGQADLSGIELIKE